MLLEGSDSDLSNYVRSEIFEKMMPFSIKSLETYASGPTLVTMNFYNPASSRVGNEEPADIQSC